MKQLLILLTTGVFLAGMARADGEELSVHATITAVADRINKVVETKNLAVDHEAVADAVEKAVFKAIDPASEILSPEEAEETAYKLNGYFYGVGLKLAVEKDGVKIVDVMKDGPAEKAGLVKGDVILEINGRNVAGNDDSKSFLSMFQGDEGDVVELSVMSKDDKSPKDMALVLGLVQQPVISMSESWPHDICYMKVEGFYDDADKDIMEAVEGWVNGAFFGIILDLRGAGGLNIDAVAAISGMLMEKDSHVFDVVDGHGKPVKHYMAGPGDKISMPVIALIDGKTCLAAELFAGVLKDAKGALLVGSPTIGDNGIREFIPYNDNVLYITVNKINLADGYDYAGQGVVPDVLVDPEDELVEFPEDDKSRFLMEDITQKEQLNFEFDVRIGQDVVLRRATDILLGLKALDAVGR